MSEYSILKERIFKFSKVNGECIETTYSLRRGYGVLKFKNKTISAHRASWMVHYGEIPEGMFVCHVCDNKKCINPHHLFIGTAKDNTRDMVSKSRGSLFDTAARKYGDEVIETAIKLRKIGNTYKQIGKELNIPWKSIVSIFRNPRNKEKVRHIYPKSDKYRNDLS